MALFLTLNTEFLNPELHRRCFMTYLGKHTMRKAALALTVSTLALAGAPAMAQVVTCPTCLAGLSASEFKDLNCIAIHTPVNPVSGDGLFFQPADTSCRQGIAALKKQMIAACNSVVTTATTNCLADVSIGVQAPSRCGWDGQNEDNTGYIMGFTVTCGKSTM